ncbi:MAG: hypothetical protein WC666_02330 [Candidatus Paceibacterota bacterium]|jgi:hypothetical protein
MALFLQIIAYVGIIETIILLVGIVWGTVLWVRGISPALFRLGNGLARRKIAVFAKGDNAGSLRSLLLDSKLFRAKNVFEIKNVSDIGKAEEASIYLVFWQDWSDSIDEILSKKPDACALVVYAPYEKGRIPDDQMKNLDGKRHTAVTNFRGRLLNDIVTAMITTSYES